MDAHCPDSQTFARVSEHIASPAVYTDVHTLHAGPIARVCSAIAHGRRIILKTPADASGRLLHLLQREYRIGIRLSHPNIAAAVAWLPQSPVGPAIEMEYIDGITLTRWLQTRPSLARRRSVLAQLLSAVDYLHKCGIVHNDLKPDNILIARPGDTLKIIDLGLADTSADVVARKPGGTPGFTAPEVYDHSTPADPRSDIYSVGALISLIFPRRLHAVARRCMHTDPVRRYPGIPALRRSIARHRRIPFILMALGCTSCLAALILKRRSIR